MSATKPKKQYCVRGGMKSDTICCYCISKCMTKVSLQNHRMHLPCVRLGYFQEKYPRDYGTVWSLYEFLITQIQSNSSYQSLPVCLQSFLVETWSDCSGTAHHHGPYMLEPTVVNSTATLVIPSLPSECHITARIRSQISSSNITFG